MRAGRKFVVGAALIALVALVGIPGGPSAGAGPAEASGGAKVASDVQASDTSTITDTMLSIENGVASGATSELVGWTMSALGLNSSGAADLQIDDELQQINQDLVAIDGTLSDIDSELDLQTCESAADTTTFDATAQIAFLNTTLEEYQDVGAATTTQVTDFVQDVLTSDTDSIPYQLVALNQALLDQGGIPGVISLCLDTIATPTAGTAGDTAYYSEVANLTNYFYGYQVEGLNLVVEAYHALAAQAYVEENPGATITADTIDTICSNATANTDVSVYCNDAVYWVGIVYQNLQEQFSLAGAPYSVAGEATTINGTPTVFVSSLEAYTQAQTSACASVLDSDDPCGPLAGTNLTSSIASPSTFAWRTDWQPASATQWAAALNWWTDSDETLGTYLGDLGFSNTTNSTKIVLTDTTYTAAPEVVLNGEQTALFQSPAVCFLDTAVKRSEAHQPWCYNGSYDGVDYGLATDLINSFSGDDCTHWTAPSVFADEDTNDFFQGTYTVGNTCSSNGWDDGIQPGWLLDSGGASATQYLWPSFDMSTATCNTNVNGSTRSTTNPQGVYTMCGSDFDQWFAQIVPTPEVTDAAPEASATDTTSGGSTTVTTGALDSDSDVTVTANSTPVVLDSTRTDFGGTLRKTYQLPGDFPVGQHSVTISGYHGGRSVTVTVPFTVLAITPKFTG